LVAHLVSGRIAATAPSSDSVALWLPHFSVS
jgi:hypothetical protein